MKQTIEVDVEHTPKTGEPDWYTLTWPDGATMGASREWMRQRGLEIPERTYTVMVSLTRDEIEARASRGQGTRFTTTIGSAGEKLDKACREYLNLHTINDRIEHST